METTACVAPDESGPVRLLIVSDIRLHRESLAQCLSTFPGLTVVAQASSSAEGLHVAESIRPEVILLDIATERSLELTTELNRQPSSPQIIAYGVHDVEHEVVACAEAGVAGCFPCDGSVADLAATLIASRRQEVRCSPKAATTLFRHVASLARQVRVQQEVSSLTTREGEILDLIDRGLSNKEIAQQLNVEVATVKNHVHNILEKLQVTSRHQAVRRMRVHAEGRLVRLAR
jgi:two-component system nitrate/nitrite response regulator NarL